MGVRFLSIASGVASKASSVGATWLSDVWIISRSLGAHRRRGLHRSHLEVVRLVAAGAGADVDHRAGIAERCANAPVDPRIRLPDARVAKADLRVVGIPG